jgi:hypothetical protein
MSDYNPVMSQPPADRRIFSLTDARHLLPTVKALTADAVHDAEELSAELEALGADSENQPPDEERERLNAELNQVVARWAGRIQELGLEAKGLWLVDFDNGHGYYCWKHPEETLLHFHGYDEGFAGRMKIV